jgi:hypothetical protein
VRRRIGLALMLLGAAAGGGCSSGTQQVPVTPPSSGTPWMLFASGSATPSPTLSPGSPTPTPNPLKPGAAAAPASPKPVPSVTDCGNDGPNFQNINGADVVTGATTGTVTWFNPGGKDIVEYRVTAIDQDLTAGPQRDPGWTVIARPAACGPMSATVTGLDRQTHYVFSVDVVMTEVGRDGTRATTIARSPVVVTK